MTDSPKDSPKKKFISRKKVIETVGKMQIRVRYQETDQMGVVHHANYFTYFEMGRTELLRQATGISYQDLENDKLKMVVVKAECSYHKPSRFDDLLTLETRVVKVSMASIVHEYHLYRGHELLVVGRVKLAMVDDEGKIVAVPDYVKNISKLEE